MDKIYIGNDIDMSYHYAVFGGNGLYVDLYNTNDFRPNQRYDYYRIYLNSDKFLYSRGVWETTQYSYTRDTQAVAVSPFWYDRPDFDKVFVCVFIVMFAIVWLMNLFTSIVRKGGLLGGLL